MRRSRLLLPLLAAMLLGPALPIRGAGAASGAAPPADLLVFAAASLTNALGEIGPAYTKATGQSVKFSFAASSVLARQIEAGARAQVFFSADTDWMSYLDDRSLIARETRRDLLGNELVLIAPAGSTVQLRIGRGFPLAGALGSGRLAVGDPASVPAGRYARAALTSLGVWASVEPHLAPAEDVRAALAYVARGEAPLGIVYRTDALVEKRVRVVDVFPPDSHPPIIYPVAATATAARTAEPFLRFLQSAAAGDIFRRFGFTVRP